MSHSTHPSARVNQITGLVFFLIIFIISNKMNGISEYHKRRVYSSSNHYGLIYQFVTDRIFYESRCAGRGDWGPFFWQLWEGFGGITDSELDQTDGYLYIVSIGQGIIFKMFLPDFYYRINVPTFYFFLDILTGSMRCLPFEMFNSEYQSGC